MITLIRTPLKLAETARMNFHSGVGTKVATADLRKVPMSQTTVHSKMASACPPLLGPFAFCPGGFTSLGT